MNNSCNCISCDLKDIFFEHLNEGEIHKMCSEKKEHNYSKGDVIIEQGEEIKEFTYLKSGLVKLFRIESDGKEQIISISKPMDFVSLLSVFSEKTYNYSVTALEDSTTCVLELEMVRKMTGENGIFALNILEKMSKASDSIIMGMLKIRQKHLRGRIAFILLYFAETVYGTNDFDLPVSRKEIAEYIGMTTENVIRILSEFRTDKIIKIFGKTIEIIDIDRLKMISEKG